MQTQYSLLGYRNWQKLAKEIDEIVTATEILTKKLKELGCMFIRIDPEKEGYDILLKKIRKSNNYLINWLKKIW